MITIVLFKKKGVHERLLYVPIRHESLHTVLNTEVCVQDIFFTLDQGTGENNYLMAKDALNKYFKPKANGLVFAK